MTQRVITGSQRWQDLGRDPWNQDAGDLDGGLDGALSDEQRVDHPALLTAPRRISALHEAGSRTSVQ